MAPSASFQTDIPFHVGRHGSLLAGLPRPRALHGWFGDHDLWGWQHGAKGAPCAGFVDTFFFMLAPLIYDVLTYDPGFGKVQYPVWDPAGIGIPFRFPNILPPMFPQGFGPGGWKGWGPTL